MFKYSSLEETVVKLIQRDFAIDGVKSVLDSERNERFSITLETEYNDIVVFDLLHLPVEQTYVSEEESYFCRDGFSDMYYEFIQNSDNNTPEKINQFIEEIKKCAVEFERKGRV